MAATASGSSGVSSEPALTVSGQGAQEPLGHLCAARVAGAEKKDTELYHGVNLLICSK
jgi:hypothetical protein